MTNSVTHRDHRKTPPFPRQSHVIPADAGTQNQQKPPSFPRTREPRINKARLFTPSRRQPPLPFAKRKGTRGSEATLEGDARRGSRTAPTIQTTAPSPTPSSIAETPASATNNPLIRALQRTERPSRLNKKPRHSRGRGNPESTKHAFLPHPRDNQCPFRSQETYESLTRNHWRSAATVLH